MAQARLNARNNVLQHGLMWNIVPNDPGGLGKGQGTRCVGHNSIVRNGVCLDVKYLDVKIIPLNDGRRLFNNPGPNARRVKRKVKHAALCRTYARHEHNATTRRGADTHTASGHVAMRLNTVAELSHRYGGDMVWRLGHTVAHMSHTSAVGPGGGGFPFGTGCTRLGGRGPRHSQGKVSEGSTHGCGLCPKI